MRPTNDKEDKLLSTMSTMSLLLHRMAFFYPSNDTLIYKTNKLKPKKQSLTFEKPGRLLARKK